MFVFVADTALFLHLDDDPVVDHEVGDALSDAGAAVTPRQFDADLHAMLSAAQFLAERVDVVGLVVAAPEPPYSGNRIGRIDDIGGEGTIVPAWGSAADRRARNIDMMSSLFLPCSRNSRNGSASNCSPSR